MLPLILLAAVSLGTTTLTSAACTRAQLQDITAVYLTSLAAGSTASITSLSSSSSSAPITYQENDVPMDISKGVLSQPIKIDFNRSIYDTTLCASYTEIVAATNNNHPYVIGTRIALDTTTSSTSQIISKIESIVCDDGDWLFNASGSLTYNKRETWDPIPLAKQDTREVLKAVADSYIDAWGDKSVNPPFATGCARLEGGSYLTGNCKLNFPPPFNVTNRRYTIDEEVGAVDMFHNFPFLDGAVPRDPGTQTNNLVRVEGGRIRYIHENTVCLKKGCKK